MNITKECDYEWINKYALICDEIIRLRYIQDILEELRSSVTNTIYETNLVEILTQYVFLRFLMSFPIESRQCILSGWIINKINALYYVFSIKIF